jgi:hypothetical protein
MDDWINIDINFPVLGVSCLPNIKLIPIAPDSYRDGTEERLIKVCASVSDNSLWLVLPTNHI